MIFISSGRAYATSYYWLIVTLASLEPDIRANVAMSVRTREESGDELSRSHTNFWSFAHFSWTDGQKLTKNLLAKSLPTFLDNYSFSYTISSTNSFKKELRE